MKDLSAYVVNNADDMDKTMTLGNKNRKYQRLSCHVRLLAINDHFIYEQLAKFPVKDIKQIGN